MSAGHVVSSRRPVGVVLVGGTSSRMGRDKAEIEVGGRTLAERATTALSGCCTEVLLAGDVPGWGGGAQGGSDTLEVGRDGAFLPCATRVDDGPGRGPAAGILGAAGARPGRTLLVLACDLPLVPAALLDLLAGDSAADFVVPGRADRLEPLCALYRPRALEALAQQVADGDLAPHRLAERGDMRVRVVGEDELREIGDPATMFTNVNRPEDLESIESLLS